MPRRVRTAKGRIIDFDLLKIKQQMATAEKPATVQQRQDFIDQKMRRRVNRVKEQIAEAKKKKPTNKNKPVDVTNKLEVQSEPEKSKIDEVKAPSPTKRKIKRKQIK